MWDIVREELSLDLDAGTAVKIAIRLRAAAALGAVVGLEREVRGRAAGLRTHMLVSLGAALFTLVPMSANDGSHLAEIVKGVAAGVGFLGAGAILKQPDEQKIRGLTTAAGIWLTAAVGLAAGAGAIVPAAAATLMSWVILAVFGYWERKLEGEEAK